MILKVNPAYRPDRAGRGALPYRGVEHRLDGEGVVSADVQALLNQAIG